jgi:hypothetical protein
MKILILIFSFLVISIVDIKSEEITRSSLYYIKFGVCDPPSDRPMILPNFGVGARFQRDYYGLDLSINTSSIVLINYASIKGLFLYYPYPEKKNQFYIGVGPGVGYHLSAGLWGSSSTKTSGSLEALIGYEFRHAEYFKTFVQLEFSQPFCSFSSSHYSSNKYNPGIAFTLGMGF